MEVASAAAPATQDLEEAFTELQALLEEQTEVETEMQKLEDLDEGDADFDEIMKSYEAEDHVDPRGGAFAYIKGVLEGWKDRHTQLCDRESEIVDQLNDAGYDMRDFYEQVIIKPKIRRMENDRNEQVIRGVVDAILNQRDKAKAASSAVTTFAPTGASGYQGIRDDEELATVDVLDDGGNVGEAEAHADKLAVYSESIDEAGLDIAVQTDDSGAQWVDGCRIAPLLNAVLKDHQKAAVLHMVGPLVLGLHGVFLAHGCGLGKSLTTLTIFEAMSTRLRGMRAIVACPKSMITTWGNESVKWESVFTLDMYPISVTDDKVAATLKPWFKHGGVAVVGHDQFRRCVDLFKVDDKVVVAIDEAHTLKTPTTQLYQVIEQLQTKRRLFLSGTPIQNRLTEYYSLVELLDPGLLGETPAQFMSLYGNAIDAAASRGATSQQKAHGACIVKALSWKLEPLLHKENSDFLSELVPMPKFECCLLHESDTPAADPSVIMARHNVHVAARDKKVEVTMALIDGIRASTDENIVVFSTRNDLLKDLTQQRDGLLYTGDMSIDKRDKVIVDFPRQPGDILYMATKAGGVGLNLTAASRVILADVSWNPVDDAQAVARSYRIGQINTVRVYRLVTNDTLELGLYRLGLKKRLLAERVDDDREVPRLFSAQDLMAFVADSDKDRVIDSDVAAAVDPVLAHVGCSADSEFSILDHDAALEMRKDEDTDDFDFDFDEKLFNSAENHYHYILSNTMRRIGVVRLEADEYVDENGLHPPHVPCLLGDDSGQLEPRVVFAADEGLWLMAGPRVVAGDGVFEDVKSVKFRITYQSFTEEDATDAAWETYPHEFPAHLASDKFRLALPPGRYRFAVQYVDVLNGITSVPSSCSAPTTILEEE